MLASLASILKANLYVGDRLLEWKSKHGVFQIFIFQTHRYHNNIKISLIVAEILKEYIEKKSISIKSKSRYNALHIALHFCTAKRASYLLRLLGLYNVQGWILKWNTQTLSETYNSATSHMFTPFWPSEKAIYLMAQGFLKFFMTKKQIYFHFIDLF